LKHIELNNEIMNKKDGFFNLEKDKEAIAEFEKEVKKNMMYFNDPYERMLYMISEDEDKNFYDKCLVEQYTKEQILEADKLAHSFGFKFQSYMAISKFYKDYSLKSNDGKTYLETFEDRVVATSLYLAKGDFEKAKRFITQMIKQNYQSATPTFLNAGKARRGEMVSCFLLEMDDTLNSIGFNINTAMQLSKIGGGVAINLSKLRARGEEIKGIEGAASGVMPVMKLLEDSFSYANQLGQRKGAGATYLNIFHWDIIEFLDTKKINADEKSRIQSLSIGIIAPSKFFELAEQNKDLYVFAPYTVYKEYGKHLDDLDIDNMYEELLLNDKIKKRKVMSARELLIKISMIQLESGYPYFMFKSNANERHALKDIGSVKMSNLCTEIFNLQETSEINDYGTDDIIKRDINCNLGSLNIVNVMENKEIRESVHVGIDALTAVSDMTSIENAPSVKKANEELHSIGLGAMNLHGYLAKNKIMYESEEARDFVRTFFMMMNYHSIEKTMEIAKEKGETFKDFDKSEYAKGTYFGKYLKTDYSPKTEKVKKLFEGIHIPTKKDWNKLKEDVQQFGMYSAYRLAIAPTQSISYVQNATSSVMPIVEHIEARTYAKSTTYYPMPYMDKSNFFFYKSAYDTDMYKMIDLIAEIQEHIDQGISTILYVNSNVSTRDLAKYYIYAHHKKLNSLYYTRTKKLSIEECTSCAV